MNIDFICPNSQFIYQGECCVQEIKCRYFLLVAIVLKISVIIVLL